MIFQKLSILLSLSQINLLAVVYSYSGPSYIFKLPVLLQVLIAILLIYIYIALKKRKKEYARQVSNRLDYEKKHGISVLNSTDFLYDNELNDNEILMKFFIQLLSENSKIDTKNLKTLEKIYKKHFIPTVSLEKLIKTYAESEIDFTNLRLTFTDEYTEKDFMLQVIHLCLTDGEISKIERKVLNQLADKFDYTRESVNYVIQKEKERLYSSES
jgi:hypothetical protein